MLMNKTRNREWRKEIRVIKHEKETGKEKCMEHDTKDLLLSFYPWFIAKRETRG